LKLIELLNTIEDGQIAKANFANETWFVIRVFGTLRYYFNQEAPTELVPLSYSNLNATYEIL
jgi:hypothetical protein